MKCGTDVNHVNIENEFCINSGGKKYGLTDEMDEFTQYSDGEND